MLEEIKEFIGYEKKFENLVNEIKKELESEKKDVKKLMKLIRDIYEKYDRVTMEMKNVEKVNVQQISDILKHLKTLKEELEKNKEDLIGEYSKIFKKSKEEERALKIAYEEKMKEVSSLKDLALGGQVIINRALVKLNDMIERLEKRLEVEK